MNGRFQWPRLGRRGKTVRNLLVCLALLLWLWSAFSYPLPTREMNFRRLEHYFLLPQGELVFREGELFVDLGEDQAGCPPGACPPGTASTPVTCGPAPWGRAPVRCPWLMTGCSS